MRVKLALAITTLVLLELSCTKTDLKEQNLETDSGNRASHDRGNHQKKCTYIEAISDAIGQTVGGPFLPLFTKEYNSENVLKRIVVHFRNIAGGIHTPIAILVRYRGDRMILIQEANADTVAILHFNNHKRLIRATAPTHLFGWNDRSDIRFFYDDGKIREIESRFVTDYPDTEPWIDYVKVKYDHSRKNVSRITFSGFGNPAGNVYYYYDERRKAKEQVYPDEKTGDYFNFWNLLKYLDIFPELRPENILKRSYYDNPEYPGDNLHIYYDHRFDNRGRLTSYRIKANLGGGDNFNIESWRIDWECQSND